VIPQERTLWQAAWLLTEPGRRAFTAYRPLFLGIQGTAAALLAVYFMSPDVRRACDVLVGWKDAGGTPFVVVSCILSGGVIPELLKWRLRPPGLPRPTLPELAHQMAIFGICGLMVNEFYKLQGLWFGPAHGWGILLLKIFIDQFIYSLFLPNPLVIVWFLWREKGFDLAATMRAVRPGLIRERLMPLWVTGLVFWVPLLLVLYSLPVGLQFVAFLLANCAWGILMVFIARRQVDAPGVRDSRLAK